MLVDMHANKNGAGDKRTGVLGWIDIVTASTVFKEKIGMKVFPTLCKT